MPLRCNVFARLNNCANCDEADVSFVQTQKTQSLYSLDFDNPDTDESQADIAPWDVTHQPTQGGPKCYKMKSQPRGQCLIINNADFKKSRENNANNEARMQTRKPLDDRAGSFKDASMYKAVACNLQEGWVMT